MNKTSFGRMSVLVDENNISQVEFLIFKTSGRSHKHNSYESFFVTKGAGTVYRDDEVIKVKVGDLVIIPPNTSHWMEPESKEKTLEAIVWYHQEKINLK